MDTPTQFWVVNRVRPWSSVLVGSQGKPAHVTDGSGTIGFLMVFPTLEQAQAYADAGEDIVSFSGRAVTNATD